MSDLQKAPYVQMFAEDKIRYERQLQERKEKGFFTMPDNSKSIDHLHDQKLFSKKKNCENQEEEVKDAQTKKVQSVYNFFCNAYMRNLRDENPDLKPIEMIKLTANKWNTLTNEQKIPYEIIHKRDKERREQ